MKYIKAGQEFNALSIVTPPPPTHPLLHGLAGAVYVVESVFLSKFSYSLLVWMSHSRDKNIKIN